MIREDLERVNSCMSLKEMFRTTFVEPITNGYLGRGHKIVVKPVTGLKGYKQIHLFNSGVSKGKPKVRMRALHYGGEHLLSGKATCRTDRSAFDSHDVPDWNCTCGFYAYKTVDEAYHHNGNTNRFMTKAWTVEVAISGKYIQYKKGYRYEHQRITSIYVGRCYACSNVATSVLLRNNDALIAPVCHNHAMSYPSRFRITFDEFAEAATDAYDLSDSKHQPISVVSVFPNECRPDTPMSLRPDDFTLMKILKRKVKKKLFSK